MLIAFAYLLFIMTKKGVFDYAILLFYFVFITFCFEILRYYYWIESRIWQNCQFMWCIEIENIIQLLTEYKMDTNIGQLYGVWMYDYYFSWFSFSTPQAKYQFNIEEQKNWTL